jgi:hypothetical protein
MLLQEPESWFQLVWGELWQWWGGEAGAEDSSKWHCQIGEWLGLLCQATQSANDKLTPVC